MSTAEKLVKKAIEIHGSSKEKLLPVLQDVCKEKNYLSEDDMVEIAKAFDVSSAEVYGVASFYSFLPTQPMGQYVIRVCQTITCDMKGKRQIIKAMEEKLRIKIGETTADGKFTLLATNCIGWCHQGPAMLINDKVYTELTPEKAVAAIDEYLK